MTLCYGLTALVQLYNRWDLPERLPQLIAIIYVYCVTARDQLLGDGLLVTAKLMILL